MLRYCRQHIDCVSNPLLLPACTSTAVKRKLLCSSACTCQTPQGTQLGHNIMRLRPQLQQEWHPRKNKHFGKEVSINPFSFERAIWTCSQCHHEWEDRVIDRACSDVGCHRCASTTTCAESKLPFMSQWNYRCNEDAGIHPEKLSIMSNQKIWWICRKCPQKWPHEFEASPLERSRRPYSCCPQCEGSKACICNDAPRQC